ncbi:hypothetical protein Tco_1429297, partial [Tanacetum coccineum]
VEVGWCVGGCRGWLPERGGWRVAASKLVDRIDPVRRSLFGVGRKTLPEKFSGGATVVTKLISDTILEVKQEPDKDGKKVNADGLQEDSRLSKSQPEIVSQNGNLSLQNADRRGVKGCAAYSYSSAAAAKIDQVVRVDVIEKLPQYLPDSETRAQIGLFTTKLAKNAGKYVVSEGFKHIPGATVATKLIADKMREVKQERDKDGMKAKVIRQEADFRSSKSQLDSVSQNTLNLAKRT